MNDMPPVIADYRGRRWEAASAQLLGYQREPAGRLLRVVEHTGRGVDASDTGVGKTYVSLAVASTMASRAFVICPKAIVPVWEELGAKFGLPVEAANYELLRYGSHPACEKVGDKRYTWKLPPDTILIFDECHRMSNHETLNCGLGMAAVRQGYRILALSATLAENASQLKFVGALCGLFAEHQFQRWAEGFGSRRKEDSWEFVGGRRSLERLHTSLFPAHGIRIRIADLGSAFPETRITTKAYDIDGAAGIYREMEAEMREIALKEMDDAKKRSGWGAAAVRARQRAEILKVPAMAEMAEDAIAEGAHVALFVNFNATMDALLERLDTDCCIRGEQTPTERQEFIRRFRADEEPAIVCNAQAGGIGIGLHGKRRVALISPPPSARTLKQVFGRVWRSGGDKSLQSLIFARGTTEERILERVAAKIQNIETINDGDLCLPNELFRRE